MQSSLKPTDEGFVDVVGGRVWFELFGAGGSGNRESEEIPLVALHGGPGFTRYPLRPLSDLSDERQVVIYDQLGCGSSEIDRSAQVNELWTIERHVEELEAVVSHLGFEHFHLFGHSWGTILAVEYALKYQNKVESLVFSSPCISIPMWVEDSKKLRKLLSKEDQRALLIGEQLGEYGGKDYLQAVEAYYDKHVCKINPKPELMERAGREACAEVYLSMWGPNELTLLGSLKDYDACQKLKQLNMPVLYICGRDDEATPETSEYYSSLTPRSDCVILENSSHACFFEEPEELVNVLRKFMLDVDEGVALRTQFLNISPAFAFGLLLLVGFVLVILAFIFSF